MTEVTQTDSGDAPRNTSNRYAHVDAMRALAVLLVVVAHAGLESVVPGGSGVTIFFTISGFIITTLLLREWDRTADFSIARFYTRRATKIGPPLLLVIVLPTIVYACWHALSAAGVAAQLLFSFNWYLGDWPSVLPGSSVLWSLAIEEQFYIGFALAWLAVTRVSRRIDPVMTTAVMAVVVIVASMIERVVLTVGMHAGSDRIYYGTDTRIEGIAWGILAATLLYASDRDPRMLSRVAGRFCRWATSDGAFVLAAALYVGSLVIRESVFRDTLRYSVQAIAAATVILWGFSAEWSRLRRMVMAVGQARLIQVIGLASYSLYIVHHPLQSAIEQTGGTLPAFISVPLLTIVSVVAGIVVWRLVEVPVQHWKDRRAMNENLLSASGQEPAEKSA